MSIEPSCLEEKATGARPHGCLCVGLVLTVICLCVGFTVRIYGGERAAGASQTVRVPTTGQGTGSDSFEDCCRRLGCTSGATIAACSTYEPEYGRCEIGSRGGLCINTSQCRGGWYPTPGYCPGPFNIQCCRPPAGPDQPCDGTILPFPNDGLAPVSYDPRCPAGMKVVADGFCIDVFEAFLEEILPDGSTTPWSPYFNPGYRTMRAVSAAGAVPQGYINANQAEAACRNAGKRLCTDAEWLRACQGSAGYTYPYGPVRRDGVCNDARSLHPAIEYFGRGDPSPFSKIWHPCLNQLPNGLDPAGARTGCASEDGIMDMMGNLHEWTAAESGTFRGGFYVDTRINGPGCRYVTTAHARSHWDYSTGFRCCADLRRSVICSQGSEVRDRECSS